MAVIIKPTIRCIEKGCKDLIVPTFIEDADEIYWVCTICKTEGYILVGVGQDGIKVKIT